jgi:hypothetical protein
MNKLTLVKGNENEKEYELMDKVEVDVLKRNKFFNKENIKCYIYY